MTTIFIDADGCPVKEEVYRVALRCGLPVKVVCNSRMRTPDRGDVELVLVGDRFDAADDWIAEHAGRDDIVVSSDIPLASRCLANGSRVLTPSGHPYDEDNIGEALASRELMSQLRDMGAVSGGPPPFTAKDRSRFLQKLDAVIRTVQRDR
jgi:uncharacterized protein YaiI (UPF0178 family)